MQGLRAEHEINVRRAFDDGRTLLAGDTAADAENDFGPQLFQMFDAAQIVKDFFLRFLAHRAGIEQNHVGVVGARGRHHAVRRVQYVGHLARVVLVHLAAEGLDVVLGRH